MEAPLFTSDFDRYFTLLRLNKVQPPSEAPEEAIEYLRMCEQGHIDAEAHIGNLDCADSTYHEAARVSENFFETQVLEHSRRLNVNVLG